MEKELMVSIDMITYKHEAYIAQAIEGVLMQETNFKYELAIFDDCSPDGTEDIIRNIIATHPKGNLIKYFRHETNIGMMGNAIFALNQCTGKYIAICEGDDYWTDPLKLQKQVDFLEANPDYSFSFHDCTILQESTKKEGLRIGDRKIDETPDLKSVIISNNMPTASLVFRTLDWGKLPKWFFEISKGDYGLVVLLAEKGRGKYFHESMSVYRVHDVGVWSSQNLEYVYKQDLLFYGHLLSYFEDLEVKNAVRKKINFTEYNFGINLTRNGNLLKGLFKVFTHSKWFMDNGSAVDFRRMASAIFQGIRSI